MIGGRSRALIAGLLAELRIPAAATSLVLAHAQRVTNDGDRLGLVSGGDLDGVVARHSADSLLFAHVRAPDQHESWVDVGSGAGFPGLVLACCYPEARFTLVEPQRRRAGFLEVCALELGLANVEVVNGRIEALHRRFDVAVARAFTDPNVALETLLRSIVPGGSAIVAVGSSAEPIPDAREILVRRDGVDSPGRLLMMTGPLGGLS